MAETNSAVTTLTAKQSGEAAAHEPFYVILSYLFRRKTAGKAWLRVLLYLSVVFTFSYVFAAIVAAGECLSLGWEAAVHANLHKWLLAPLWGLVVLLGVVVSLLLTSIAEPLSNYLSRLTGWKADAIGRNLYATFVTIIVVVFIVAIVWAGYDNGQKIKTNVGRLDANDFGSIGNVAAEQQASLVNLSDSAKKMLGSLDAIQTEITASKKQLNDTLTDLSAQEQQANAAAERMKTLAEQEVELKSKIEEVEAIVGGKRIITADDLAASNRENFIEGVFITFIVGIVSMYVYDMIRKKETALPSPPA